MEADLTAAVSVLAGLLPVHCCLLPFAVEASILSLGVSFRPGCSPEMPDIIENETEDGKIIIDVTFKGLSPEQLDKVLEVLDLA